MARVALARLLGAEPRTAEPAGAPAVVEERDPARFVAAFAATVAGGGPVFLADPGWGAAERSQFAALLALPVPPCAAGWLMIPSGGTGGRLKFARHDEETLGAAVRGFCARVQRERVHCVGLLPLHHVSGFVAWMRTALTGGTYQPWDWKRLEAGERPPEPGAGGGWFLSLVPTQLQRLLVSAQAVDWLRRFDAVFLGGGPAWPALTEAAAEARVPLAPSYGLTETAAMVAALPPAEFLAGARSCGPALPHARIDLTDDGLVRISGASVFRGYYPEWSDARTFVTEDLGRFDDRGHLHLLGRRDAVVITGGKKVDPLEVEAALRAGGQFSDVAVVGVPDPEWGEAVVACYPEDGHPPDLAAAAAGLGALAAFKRPRRFLAIADWPRNPQGKLNRAELMRRAQQLDGQG